MYKAESIQEYEMHKIYWDFEMQMDHQISAIRPDLIYQQHKKNL